MKKTLTSLTLAFGLSFLPVSMALSQSSQPVLERIEFSEAFPFGLDEQIWGNNQDQGDKQNLLYAIDHSLTYLNSNKARADYENYPITGITLERVRRSLQRFRTLLNQSATPQEFQAAVEKEFVFYQSVGNDGEGTVAFTGYFEPVYEGSLVRTEEYRYPLYRRPWGLDRWGSHPTRAEIEGEDGLLGVLSPIRGYELVWLRDRLEAYLIQVQGSAQINLTNGKVMSVGFAGNTDFPYTSLGKELIADGVIPEDEMSLPRLIQYFEENPSALNTYIPRNNRFIFFRETFGAPPSGSLGVPVTPERSIATDKSIMPPGALALIRTEIPYVNQATGELENRLVTRYVLDQDTGSAIKGAGRVDIFMGSGEISGDRAGLIDWTGSLYYLLLKD
jgi:membrane-bound lytic murein transglycosylase A